MGQNLTPIRQACKSLGLGIERLSWRVGVGMSTLRRWDKNGIPETRREWFDARINELISIEGPTTIEGVES